MEQRAKCVEKNTRKARKAFFSIGVFQDLDCCVYLYCCEFAPVLIDRLEKVPGRVSCVHRWTEACFSRVLLVVRVLISAACRIRSPA